MRSKYGSVVRRLTSFSTENCSCPISTSLLDSPERTRLQKLVLWWIYFSYPADKGFTPATACPKQKYFYLFYSTMLSMRALINSLCLGSFSMAVVLSVAMMSLMFFCCSGLVLVK